MKSINFSAQHQLVWLYKEQCEVDITRASVQGLEVDPVDEEAVKEAISLIENGGYVIASYVREGEETLVYYKPTTQDDMKDVTEMYNQCLETAINRAFRVYWLDKDGAQNITAGIGL